MQYLIMKMFETLDRIENTSGSNNKITLLVELLNSNEDAEKFLRAAYDDTVYNISTKSIENALGLPNDKKFKDIGAKVEYYQKTSTYISSYTFDQLLQDTQKYSGNDLLEKILDFLCTCSPIKAKWYSRVLVKDLKMGINIKTVNKIFKQVGVEEIEVFKCGLCKALPNKKEELTKKLTRIGLPLFAEPKFDGVRLIISQRGDIVRAQSRNGKDVNTVQFLLDRCKKIFGNTDFTIDGELIHKEGFNALMSQVHRKDGIVDDGKAFVVFDMMHFNGTDLKSEPLDRRRKHLKAYISKDHTQDIFYIPQHAVETVDEVWSKFNRSVDQGYEGLILKTNAPYTETYDRKNWFKIKPIKEMSLEIVDFSYGTGKYKDMISVLTVVDKNRLLRSEVGTGLSDRDRKYLTTEGRKLYGRIVEIAFDCVSRAQNSETYSLRFPRFLRFRDDLSEADKWQE
jgi:ATP-dependent DNA ligase